MGFLGGLFKKKPGGTFFGNLLRAGVSTVSGGMLGAGNNRIELGNTKTNAEIAKEQAATPAPGTNPDGFANTNQGGAYAAGGSQEKPLNIDEVAVRVGSIINAGRDNPLDKFTLDPMSQQQQQNQTNMLMLGGAALLAMLFMSKK